MNDCIFHTNQLITNPNDAYLYFEVVNNTNVTSILDVGMFLKRSGALCRQVADCEIKENVLLDGVDLMPHISLPIYSAIYNHITNKEQLFSCQDFDRNYQLVFTLYLSPFFSFSEEEALYYWIRNHTDHIVTDATAINRMPFLSSFGTITDLSVEDRHFVLIKLRTDKENR